MNVSEWRNANRKCKWCKHFSSFDPIHIDPSYSGEIICECKAKDKFVYPNVPRIFCKTFSLKEYPKE